MFGSMRNPVIPIRTLNDEKMMPLQSDIIVMMSYKPFLMSCSKKMFVKLFNTSFVSNIIAFLYREEYFQGKQGNQGIKNKKDQEGSNVG